MTIENNIVRITCLHRNLKSDSRIRRVGSGLNNSEYGSELKYRT